MKANGSCFSLSDCCIIDASSPVKPIEFSLRQEQVTVSIVITWAVPILKGELTKFRVQSFSDQAPVSPHRIDSISCQREIIFIWYFFFIFLSNMLVCVLLMSSKNDTLPTFVRSIGALLILCIRKYHNITKLSCFYDKLCNFKICNCLVIVLIVSIGIPILDSHISTPAILFQRCMCNDRYTIDHISYLVQVLYDTVIENGQVSTLKSMSQIVLQDVVNAAVHKAIPAHPAISSRAKVGKILHELMQILVIISNGFVWIPVLIKPVEVNMPNSFVAQLPSYPICGLNCADLERGR